MKRTNECIVTKYILASLESSKQGGKILGLLKLKRRFHGTRHV